MPCYMVYRQPVSYSIESTDVDLLYESMLELGYVRNTSVGRYSAEEIVRIGTFKTQRPIEDVNALKRVYARTAVEKAAKRFRFNVQVEGPNRLTLRSRR